MQRGIKLLQWIASARSDANSVVSSNWRPTSILFFIFGKSADTAERFCAMLMHKCRVSIALATDPFHESTKNYSQRKEPAPLNSHFWDCERYFSFGRWLRSLKSCTPQSSLAWCWVLRRRFTWLTSLLEQPRDLAPYDFLLGLQWVLIFWRFLQTRR